MLYDEAPPVRSASIAESIKAKRDAAVAAGEEHWVECYDPVTGCFYYYGNYSGQVMWEKPEHYVMAADDELMTAVVRIQLTFRTHMTHLLDTVWLFYLSSLRLCPLS